MSSTKRRVLVAIVGVSLAAGLPSIGSRAATVPKDDKAVVHVLNRIGFGPRDGDVERVNAIGLPRYIDEQLHPERIPDAAMSARLSGLTTLGLSSREIAETYEVPQLQARREKKQQQAQSAPGDMDKPPAMPDPLQQKANRVILELGEQKMLRAVYSDRQLQEVLTDFWFNHFNVDARKGPTKFLLTEYERDVIRPHVLGKFRDLLDADAKSPAMLFYLDNWMSADPNGPHATAPPPRLARGRFGGRMAMPPPPRPKPQGKNAPKGLNENYGRELMELHTLGVDGGYTQKDVTEVARALTGWTIQNPRLGGSFRFEPRIHDEGQKIVLGHVIKAGGGQNDGEQVLDILARHPSTARFIATKLVRRFVSDTPPPALVDRAAARFRDTDGDLRDVMRTILTSSEFLSPGVYRAKVKTPFEFVASALRATGADVQDATQLVRAMQQLGMPLYMCQPPTGYKDTADAWVNTGALVNRMNFSLSLASNKMRGVVVDSLNGHVDSPAFVQRILGDDISETTRNTVAKANGAPQMAALTLGAPEFQRR
jgi:uncharacterized protein (DUF1800 family)